MSPETPDSKIPVLYTVAEAAEYLGYSRYYLYRAIRQGRLPSLKLGTRTVRVTHEALLAYMRKSESKNPGLIQNRKRQRSQPKEAGVPK